MKFKRFISGVTLVVFLFSCLFANLNFASAEITVQDMTTIKYGFEDGEGGEISDWTAIGGATIGASTDNSKNGFYSMKVSGRTETYEGPQLSLLNDAVQGQTYYVSAWVYIDGDTPASTKITAKVTDDTGDDYKNIAEIASPAADTWVNINGTVKLEYEGTLTAFDVYIESADTSYAFLC